MTNKIELLDQARRRSILSVMIALGIWQLSALIQNVLQEQGYGGQIELYTLPVVLIGAGFYMYYIYRNNKLCKAIASDPEAKEALNNELVKANRLRAYRFAYQVLLLSIAVSYIFSLFTNVGSYVITHSLLIIAVVSLLGAFLYFDRE